MTEERERERVLHFTKCPKCGAQLEEIVFCNVYIDKCFGCGGIWLDKGELEIMQKKDAGFMDRLFSVFRQGPTT